jgi:hypothetical protein
MHNKYQAIAIRKGLNSRRMVECINETTDHWSSKAVDLGRVGKTNDSVATGDLCSAKCFTFIETRKSLLTAVAVGRLQVALVFPMNRIVL